MDCRFCNIQEEHPDRLLREGKYTFAILSDPRLMEGHILVIPKRHVEKMSQLSREERDELLDETIKIEEKLLTKVSGIDIAQHYRPFIPENLLKVNHLHVHIRPRELNDELYSKVQIYEKSVFTPLTEEEITEFKSFLSDV
ncbi:MAG TPA: HIT family protein [Candidatus Paceibacterota bacterium]|nr:HIT family protein [Candidatus Paceibacterota bacterium]